MVISCKDDDDDPAPTPTVYDNYAQLKVGNYWIYQRFDVDSSGNATPTSVFDSCYVEKDTLINNLTYFKMVRPNPFPPLPSESYLRDSVHYTVGVGGGLYFSSQDFIIVFDASYGFGSSSTDTIYKVTKKMTDKDWFVTVPLGGFITSNYKINYQMFPVWSFAGNPRAMNTRYAKNVGIVSETLPFFASNPNYLERRLVRFHLN
ncbi:MAG: hypothetical protein IPP71_02760 [Bacteroidetes bacterium]|nr:hypothetical protein [Bacteroidota bacterium]